jgi:hypothetical protein
MGVVSGLGSAPGKDLATGPGRGSVKGLVEGRGILVPRFPSWLAFHLILTKCKNGPKSLRNWALTM